VPTDPGAVAAQVGQDPSQPFTQAEEDDEEEMEAKANQYDRYADEYANASRVAKMTNWETARVYAEKSKTFRGLAIGLRKQAYAKKFSNLGF
jgi:hypothetical protein